MNHVQQCVHSQAGSWASWLWVSDDVQKLVKPISCLLGTEYIPEPPQARKLTPHPECPHQVPIE